LIPGRTKAEVNFNLMKSKNLEHLAEITFILLEEIQYEKYDQRKENKKIEFRDFMTDDDFEVVLDKNWNYLAFYNTAQLTIGTELFCVNIIV